MVFPKERELLESRDTWIALWDQGKENLTNFIEWLLSVRHFTGLDNVTPHNNPVRMGCSLLIKRLMGTNYMFSSTEDTVVSKTHKDPALQGLTFLRI